MNYPMKPISHETELALLSISEFSREGKYDHTNLLTPERLIEVVAHNYGYTFAEVITPNRAKRLVLIRQVLIYNFVTNWKLTQQATGDLFNRDHSTVNASIKKVLNRAYDPEMNQIYKEVFEIINTHSADLSINKNARRNDYAVLARIRRRFGLEIVKINGCKFKNLMRFNGISDIEVNEIILRLSSVNAIRLINEPSCKNGFQIIDKK